MKTLYWVTWVLTVVGALNWGLIGFFNFNLVAAIFGAGTVATVVYDLVGLSALWMIVAAFKKTE
ncbi:MAG: DUF378 domain-containing protein [bacterium]|jgi:hypothetical protein